MRVDTHIAGSHCVVYPTDNPETYIDCRKETRLRDVTRIEVVMAGQVRRRLNVDDRNAPESIIKIARELKERRHA